MTQGEIESLDEGGVERTRLSGRLESLREMSQVAQAHETFDMVESTTAISFFDLPIEDVACDLPTHLAGDGVGEPLTEVGGQGVKVKVEAVEGKGGETSRCEGVCQGMDDRMCHRLSARADLKRGDELGDGVTGGPHPEVVRLVAQGGE